MKASNTKLNFDPRQFLSNELERRCNQNPKYSLRAFATALEISPSTLSLVLSGHRGFSKSAAYKVAKKLGLDPATTSNFVSGSLKRGRIESVDKMSFSTLDLDRFATISEWYHFAILSLIETKDFRADKNWIASRLDISVNEASAAIERLVRLQILDTQSEKWKQIGAPIFLDNKESTAATKRYQTQVLEKARHSLENDPRELREINSVTLAIDPKLIPHARAEIKKFLKNLMADLEEKGNSREVYHLNVQLCPVSKNRGN